MRSHVIPCLLTIAALFFGSSAMAGPPAPAGRVMINADYQLSGPYTCQNLSIFLIHGAHRIEEKRLISLAEALADEIVTIDETGDVNRLTAQNHSDDVHVFIQSGDIVKGGRQDRTLAQDVIIPPRSKKIDLDSFCVEQGRWQKRGTENDAHFSSSEKRLSSKQLKLAAKKAQSQQAVWKAVAAEQVRLGRNVGKSVQNRKSATSLQLSLEDNAVETKNREYQKDLLPAARQEEDAVGFAFAINGAFNSADIYGDPDLFQQLWPGLLESAACEALALSDRQTAQASVDAGTIKVHILEALNGHKTKALSSKSTQRRSGETKTNHAFETRDEKGRMIHLNIIQKDR